jgi:hypothetical protein
MRSTEQSPQISRLIKKPGVGLIPSVQVERRLDLRLTRRPLTVLGYTDARLYAEKRIMQYYTEKRITRPYAEKRVTQLRLNSWNKSPAPPSNSPTFFDKGALNLN